MARLPPIGKRVRSSVREPVQFVTYAVEARFHGDVPELLKLSSVGVAVTAACGIDFPEDWVWALGRNVVDQFRTGGRRFFLTATQPLNAAGPSDAEYRVAAVYRSLWLHGLLRVDDVHGVHGNVGATSRMPVSTIVEVMPIPTTVTPVVTPSFNDEFWDSVDRVATGYYERNRRGQEFRRLWHGLQALERGLRDNHDQDALERQANLVRSLEVLVFDPDNKTHARASVFGRRAASMVNGVAEVDLVDAYTHLRNAALHMHDRQKYLDKQHVLANVERLTGIVEDLVPAIWREVLGNPEALEAMSDARIRAFWDALDVDPGRAWPGQRVAAREARLDDSGGGA